MRTAYHCSSREGAPGTTRLKRNIIATGGWEWPARRSWWAGPSLKHSLLYRRRPAVCYDGSGLWAREWAQIQRRLNGQLTRITRGLGSTPLRPAQVGSGCPALGSGDGVGWRIPSEAPMREPPPSWGGA